MGSVHDRVVIITKTPDIPGHSGRTLIQSAYRKARTQDDRFWQVRSHWWSTWRWLPRHGVITTLVAVHDG